MPAQCKAGHLPFFEATAKPLKKRRKKTTTPKLGVWLARFLIGFWMRGDAKRLRGGRSHTHWATKVALGCIAPATTCGCQMPTGASPAGVPFAKHIAKRH